MNLFPRQLRGHALRHALLAALMMSAGLLCLEAITWPDVAAIRREPPRSTAFIDRHVEREKAAGRSGSVEWTWVPISRISRSLALAALVAEDDTFYQHSGFATTQMKAALAEAWEKRELPRGASTITQQLAKNLWLSPSRNPWRKVKEALLTVQLEQELEKRRILEVYLNVAEFGKGVYGAEAAARHYFRKSAAELSESEAAELAASLPMPSKWHPGSSSRAWQERSKIILARMQRSRWLSE